MKPDLKERQLANHHRRVREQVLSSCPLDVSSWLEPLPVTTGLEVEDVVRSWPWASYTHTPPVPAIPVPNWSYRDSGSLLQILELAAGLPQLSHGNGYLYIHREGPLFHVDVAEWLPYRNSLVRCSDQQGSPTLGIVRQDLTHGMLFDSYSGGLPEHLQQTGSEIVYELMWW